jgi:hypothetical protein
MWALGLIAGIVGVVAYLPYIRDILAGKTKPERASWIIWGIEYMALFAAQAVQGAAHSLWLIGLQLLGVLVVCGLSMRFGTGGFSKGKVALLVGACLAIAAWRFTDNPNIAILLLVGIETAAIIPTITKAYREPGSETMSTWILIGLAGMLTLPAVGSNNPSLYAYPASLVLINFGVAAAMIAGGRRKSTLETEAEKL